jgi:hypothetical protein
MRRSHRIAIALAVLCGGGLLARGVTATFVASSIAPLESPVELQRSAATPPVEKAATSFAEASAGREPEDHGVRVLGSANDTLAPTSDFRPRAGVGTKAVEPTGTETLLLHGGMASDAAPPPAPRLDPPTVTSGSVTATVSGFDPASPRRLTLWRVEGERAARLAETESEGSGRFRFPEVAATGVELVVAPAGEVPEKSAARVRLPGPAVEPAVAEISGQSDGVRMLRIWPSAAAEYVIVAADGQALARQRVPVRPAARDRMLALAVELPASGATLWIAEERVGGERSAWRRVELSPEEAGSPEEAP